MDRGAPGGTACWAQPAGGQTWRSNIWTSLAASRQKVMVEGRDFSRTAPPDHRRRDEFHNLSSSLKSSYTRGPQLNASLRIVKRQIPYKQFTGVAASKGLYLAHWQERPRTNWPYVFVLGGSRVDHAKALDARR